MIEAHRIDALQRREERLYRERHPRCAALAAAAAPRFLYGLPMHWMRDWPVPHPLFVARATGARLECADGHRHADFCLGDSGAMYGHSPAPVAQALAAQSANGLTAMLPGERLAATGEALRQVFGLPQWQLALSASDANRFVIRWARAVTGRPRVLVFDGCYHGTVEDTLVDLAPDGKTLARASLLGQLHDLASGTVVVPFNDEAALERALARGDVACVLTEPALTNCGMVLPLPGFMAAVQAHCRRHGAWFVLDETHTLSTGLGGYARGRGLAPDVLVVGKAVAGGLPCAVYGFTDALAERMQAAKAASPEGHSGIGTTLSASLLTLAALHANLTQVMTADAHRRMDAGAARLSTGLQAAIDRARLPWCVVRLGARVELQFRERPPVDAAQARSAMSDELSRTLHLYLLNRGVIVTPFHGMWLVAPSTGTAELDRAVRALDDFVSELCAPA